MGNFDNLPKSVRQELNRIVSDGEAAKDQQTKKQEDKDKAPPEKSRREKLFGYFKKLKGM